MTRPLACHGLSHDCLNRITATNQRRAQVVLAGKQVYLSLGSNRATGWQIFASAPWRNLAKPESSQRVSSFYKTEPVDFGPQAWFLNCAVEARRDLMPMQLLKAVKSVERALGRRPGVAKARDRLTLISCFTRMWWSGPRP